MIQHWIELAEKADAMAAYYESRGEYSGVERHKALSYRRTAKSLELGRDTGMPHCPCCLKPMANHYR